VGFVHMDSREALLVLPMTWPLAWPIAWPMARAMAWCRPRIPGRLGLTIAFPLVYATAG